MRENRPRVCHQDFTTFLTARKDICHLQPTLWAFSRNISVAATLWTVVRFVFKKWAATTAVDAFIIAEGVLLWQGLGLPFHQPVEMMRRTATLPGAAVAFAAVAGDAAAQLTTTFCQWDLLSEQGALHNHLNATRPLILMALLIAKASRGGRDKKPEHRNNGPMRARAHRHPRAHTDTHTHTYTHTHVYTYTHTHTHTYTHTHTHTHTHVLEHNAHFCLKLQHTNSIINLVSTENSRRLWSFPETFRGRGEF